MEESCCTCATLLKNILLQYDEKSEKPKALDRRLDCCGRVICGNCIADNPRFATYCRNNSFPKQKPPLIMSRSFLSSLYDSHSLASRPSRSTFVYSTFFVETLTPSPRSASIFRRASIVLVARESTNSAAREGFKFTIRGCPSLSRPRA
jgi:hypothetical protein